MIPQMFVRVPKARQNAVCRNDWLRQRIHEFGVQGRPRTAGGRDYRPGISLEGAAVSVCADAASAPGSDPLSIFSLVERSGDPHVLEAPLATPRGHQLPRKPQPGALQNRTGRSVGPYAHGAIVLPRHSRERSNAQNRDFGSLRSTSTGTRVMRQRWTSGEHSPVRQQQLPPPSEQLIAVHIMTSRHDRHRRPSLGPTRCPPPVCTTPPPRAPYFSRIRTPDP